MICSEVEYFLALVAQGQRHHPYGTMPCGFKSLRVSLTCLKSYPVLTVSIISHSYVHQLTLQVTMLIIDFLMFFYAQPQPNLTIAMLKTSD
jgi:hypothetical protein